jgi:hypothetical protein
VAELRIYFKLLIGELGEQQIGNFGGELGHMEIIEASQGSSGTSAGSLEVMMVDLMGSKGATDGGPLREGPGCNTHFLQ